jgi:hypothetical protein
MEKIFTQGAFQSYSQIRLDESRSYIFETHQQLERKTTVFISHKHEDLEDLKGVLGFLQSQFDVKVYIDSQDSSMPPIASEETAINLKNRIVKCDKFIFLATNAAIESKWCNWELGFGDAQKYKKHIALFPMKPKGTSDYLYKGSEYLSIYPYVKYSDGTEKNRSGTSIAKGYYVVTSENGVTKYTPLRHWFSSR